jgi:hypothetical protein
MQQPLRSKTASASEHGLHKRIVELEAHLAAAQHALRAAAHAQLRTHPPSDAAPPVAHDAALALQHQQQPKGWYASVDDIPPGSTVWVTFVNGDEKYREMMINWAYHLRQVNVPHLVVAFDDVAAGVCEDKGIPFLRCAAQHGAASCRCTHWRPACPPVPSQEALTMRILAALAELLVQRRFELCSKHSGT